MNFAGQGKEERAIEFSVSYEMVDLAAQAVGCEPARIAKTLSFSVKDEAILIVAAGDDKIDNVKCKSFLRQRQKC